MRNRYEVTGPWSADARFGDFITQDAPIKDKLTGTLYPGGAFRVVDGRTGKPAKKGKGGTVPFYGETAWMDAERLANDLAMAEAFK